MSHTITIRPRADFEPRVEGIVNHTVVVEDGVEIVQESLIYIRALRDALTARIDAVEAAERGPEPAVLKHPGTWLPGDQFIDSDGDIWTRGDGSWYFRDSATGKSFKSASPDSAIENIYNPGVKARITHLVPRSEVA